jgi:hypothetical protein
VDVALSHRLPHSCVADRGPRPARRLRRSGGLAIVALEVRATFSHSPGYSNTTIIGDPAPYRVSTNAGPGPEPDPEPARRQSRDPAFRQPPAVVADRPEVRFDMNSGAASTPMVAPEGACRSHHRCRSSTRRGAVARVREQPRHRSSSDCWKRTKPAASSSLPFEHEHKSAAGQRRDCCAPARAGAGTCLR